VQPAISSTLTTEMPAVDLERRETQSRQIITQTAFRTLSKTRKRNVDGIFAEHVR
jgi:hypothetical protein